MNKISQFFFNVFEYLFRYRIGLYFNVRQLLLKGLEKVSSSKIPFLHSMVTKIVPNLDMSNGEGVQQQFRLAGDLVGRQPLVTASFIRSNHFYILAKFEQVFKRSINKTI